MLKKLLALSVLLFGASTAHADSFKLSSPTIQPDAMLTQNQVFNGFGCQGKNISPALKWSDAPKGTKSFALTVYDPDAPTGSGWWHWLVYNIPANVNELVEGAGNIAGTLLPKGAVQGKTDFGSRDFGGACPPAGDKPHHYIFTLYALKIEKLELPTDASAALIGFNLHANQLAKAVLATKFSR